MDQVAAFCSKSEVRVSRPIVTLTTDFGTADGYVGALKGVILSIAPQARLVDITHQVSPQAVRHAAHTLVTAVPCFPAGSVHLVVVDPGVGGGRRAMALATPQALFVGPDNGLFTPFLGQRLVCVELNDPAYHRSPVSQTFHGRDIFAPAAAHLANGVPLARLGAELTDPLTLPGLESQAQKQPDGGLAGQVIHVDHFGNLVTNIRSLAWQEGAVDLAGERIDPANLQVVVADRPPFPLGRTYAQVPSGQFVAYLGSGGALEIGLRDGNAAQALDVEVGAPVALQIRPSVPQDGEGGR